MQVHIKQELETLDRNDFESVCELVDKIVFDLNDILVKCDSEIMLGAATDYMIDLINPEFLDFGEKAKNERY
jgi:hypothetical protein